MTYEYMELTRQVATSHWGWTIAFFLWFVGLSGMSLTVNYWLKSRRLHYLATGAALVGTLLVVSHLARMLNLPMAAINALIEWKFNFTSWMFIGICILAVLCVVTILQAWVMRRAEKAGEVSSCAESQAVGVPLWTTGALPVLWIFSGLACALGTVEVMTATRCLEGGERRWVPTAATIVHLGEAFVLFAFVHVAFQGTPGSVAGARSLVSGDASTLFWAGAVGVGIVVPMLLSCVKNHTAALVGGLCAILGALALRASVLFAGYFEPILF